MVQFQKLTRNLFLTLHWHNLHRQHWQLSKFLMRCQQFASHAYCRAAGPVSKMASQQEKTFFVLRFEVSRFVITVQREFRARFRKDALCRNNITRWYRQFVETGCLCKGKSPGRPRVADMLHRVWDEFDYRVGVSCDPGCTHWRTVINAWETWTVAAADGVGCVRVRWEINFLLTFETAPFFYVHPVYFRFYFAFFSFFLPSFYVICLVFANVPG
jgi:hypothetical protein